MRERTTSQSDANRFEGTSRPWLVRGEREDESASRGCEATANAPGNPTPNRGGVPRHTR
jgi:hypothetical protein